MASFVSGNAKQSNQELDGLEGGKDADARRMGSPQDGLCFRQAKEEIRNGGAFGCSYGGSSIGLDFKLVRTRPVSARMAGARFARNSAQRHAIMVMVMVVVHRGMATRHHRRQQRNHHYDVL